MCHTPRSPHGILPGHSPLAVPFARVWPVALLTERIGAGASTADKAAIARLDALARIRALRRRLGDFICELVESCVVEDCSWAERVRNLSARWRRRFARRHRLARQKLDERSCGGALRLVRFPIAAGKSFLRSSTRARSSVKLRCSRRALSSQPRDLREEQEMV